MRRVHPSGYQVADDSPAFVAPPLELRHAVEAADAGSVEDAVAYALTFPIEERAERRAVERTVGFEPDHETTDQDAVAHPVGEEPDTYQDLPIIDPERTIERAPLGATERAPLGATERAPLGATERAPLGATERAPLGATLRDGETTVERDPYRDGEVTIQASERDVLVRSLASIGPLDESPDPHGAAPSHDRVLLARARAIRFRLALLDVWPEDWSAPRGTEDLLDLAIHPTAVVAIADGFPSDPETGVGSDDIAVVSAIVHGVRDRMPAITRATLRDAGAAAFARVTLLGTARAVQYLRDRFADAPGADRRAAVAAASRVATPGARATTLSSVRVALST
ncbi:MAG: hypothetical protein HYV09_38100 [Deltaproteobacteria bacterium]|nr:hypothetical protein [Deltaproteobacteria bacterium]